MTCKQIMLDLCSSLVQQSPMILMVKPRRRKPKSFLKPDYQGFGDFPSKKEAPFGRPVFWAIDFRLERVDDLLETKLVDIWLASHTASIHSFCVLLNWTIRVKGSRSPSLIKEIHGNTVKMFTSWTTWSSLFGIALSPGKRKGSQSSSPKSTRSNAISYLNWARWIGSQNSAALCTIFPILMRIASCWVSESNVHRYDDILRITVCILARRILSSALWSIERRTRR